MKKSVNFPMIPAFSLSNALFDGVCSTADEAALLIMAEPTLLLAERRVYSLSLGDAVLLPPFTLASVCGNTENIFCGHRITLPQEILRILTPKALLRAADGGAAFALGDGALSTARALAMEDAQSVFTLVSLLSQLEQNASVACEREKPLPRILRRILAYLNECYAVPHDMDALAARVEISKSTLLRLFRKHLSVTPLEYLRHTRTVRAAQMLFEGRSHRDVAAACGFSSVPLLERALRDFYPDEP